MAEQRHSQSPPESQLWKGLFSPRTPSPPPGPHSHPVPRLTPLTRTRHTHTTRSAAAGAPLRGTGQKATAASPRSGRGPSWPGGRSPTGTAPWTSQTPPAAPGLRILPPTPRRFPAAAPHALPPACRCSRCRGVAGLLARGRVDSGARSGQPAPLWAPGRPGGSAGHCWHLHQNLHTAQTHGHGTVGTEGSRGQHCGEMTPWAFLRARGGRRPRAGILWACLTITWYDHLVFCGG